MPPPYIISILCESKFFHKYLTLLMLIWVVNYFKKLFLFYFILFYFSSNKYGLTFKDKKLKLKLLSPKPKDVNYITQSLTHIYFLSLWLQLVCHVNKHGLRSYMQILGPCPPPHAHGQTPDSRLHTLESRTQH